MCVYMQKRKEDSREEREKEMCVCMCDKKGEGCVRTHEMKLHGCVACVTKSLSWMTYKEVNVHAVRELIQRSVHTQLLPPRVTLHNFKSREMKNYTT